MGQENRPVVARVFPGAILLASQLGLGELAPKACREFWIPEVTAQGELDCPCTEVSLSNQVYKNIAGALSLRRHNERRVDDALALITGFDPWFMNSTGILAPHIVQAIAKATNNWRRTYPPARWGNVVRFNAACANQYFPSGQPYSVWVEKFVPAGDAHAVDKWSSAVASVIENVPGGEPTSTISTRPNLDQILTVTPTSVSLSPWMISFLNVFSPGWQTAGLKAQRLTGLVAKAAAPPPSSRDTTGGGTEAPPKSFWSKYGLYVAGGLLVAGGAGYWYLTTQKAKKAAQ